jgi:hypothetical protein
VEKNAQPDESQTPPRLIEHYFYKLRIVAFSPKRMKRSRRALFHRPANRDFRRSSGVAAYAPRH